MHDEVRAAPAVPDRSSPGTLTQVVANTLGQLQYLTVYGSPAVAIGAIVAFAGVCAGRPLAEIPLLVLLGIALYTPFLGWYFQPHKIVERKFKLLDRWVDAKIFTGSQRKQWKEEMLAWYKNELMLSLPKEGKLPPLISRQRPPETPEQAR
jgi:hypothetical protein